MTNPIEVYRQISEAYLRYVDSAYWLRSEDLMAERRSLLTSSDLLFTDVLIEPVVPYDATEDLLEVAERAGLDQESASMVGRALFGRFVDPPGSPIKLRAHQAEALDKPVERAHWEQNRSVGGLAQEGGPSRARARLVRQAAAAAAARTCGCGTRRAGRRP